MSSELYFEGSDYSISDKLIRQLARSSEDLTKSLEKFTSMRDVAVQSQKLALVAYEEEMRQIEGGPRDEYYEEPAITVDHNVLRHLNIDRNSDKYHEFEHISLTTIINDVNEEQGKPGIEIKFPVELAEKPPMPSVEEKKNMREAMFDFLDESRIEEMRLELELEQARNNGEKKTAEELAEALYLVQKMNGDKLKKMLTDYQPAGIGKNWGNDSDYTNMLRNLNDITSGGPRNSSKKVDLFTHKKKKRRSKKRDQEDTAGAEEYEYS